MNSLRLQHEKSAQKGNREKCSPPPSNTRKLHKSVQGINGRVQRDIKDKEKAIEMLSRRYGKRPGRGEKLPPTIMGEEEVKQVLYAVGDNHGTPQARPSKDICY